ncbi:MAG: permease-like cell division protein FtsX [candidate division Zixibacteria bacterium]|nr:permease-like cell division protein FtsX [candidate division Zixibacteria bacterium]
MRLLWHTLKELFRNLVGHPGTTISSLMSLTLLFLLFDLFWIAAGTSERFYSRLLSDLEMELFLKPTTSHSAAPAIQDSLKVIDGVRTVEFVSAAQARERLAELVGTDLLAGYDSANPLPASYLLTFEEHSLTTAAVAAIEAKVSRFENVDQVFYGRRWLSKAEETRAIILSLGMILGGLILLAALIGSANNIRLMTQTRAVGFYQMQVLGAGKLFLAAPFLMEGLLISGLSGAAGWAAILYVRSRISFARFEPVLPELNQIALFIAAVAVIGLISGYLGIRKLLK